MRYERVRGGSGLLRNKELKATTDPSAAQKGANEARKQMTNTGEMIIKLAAVHL
jgi:hypothetical protein